MTKRYYKRDYEELFYIIDSQVVSEKEFDEKIEYDGYTAFGDSLTGEEIVNLLNENEKLENKYIDEYALRETLQQELQRVENENEQLREVINEDEKLIQSTYDELTKLRCIKANLSRIKSEWSRMMEAIDNE